MDMAVEALNTEAERALAAQYDAAKAALPGADNEWARTLRAEAMRAYTAAGLPHRRIEEWKYTDLRGALSEAYPLAPAHTLGADDVDGALGAGLAGLEAHRLVIVDGQYAPDLSDVAGLGEDCEILSLAEALAAPADDLQAAFADTSAPDSVVALNTALMSDGVVVRIGAGVTLDRPLHIVHVQGSGESTSVATRNLVSIGDGATVTLLESYVSASAAALQRNAASVIHVGDGATLHHVKFQRENETSTHLSTWMTRLGAEATYRAFQFSTGAGLARNQIFVRFDGEGSSSHVAGAFLGRGSQHNDTTMVIDHAVPGCESRELNKAVLDGEAKGVVQCKVIVQQDAQKTDGHQMAQALLLSETAEFDSKPELEIFADDVVCGHGSTSGQIDEELLFYLRARGIPEPQARALLIAAFVGEAVEQVEDEAIRDVLMETATDWLPREDG